MDRQLWSIQLYYSDSSCSSLPIISSKLAKFIKERRRNEGNIIRQIKPIGMWLLEYAIHTTKTAGDDRNICKITVETGGK